MLTAKRLRRLPPDGFHSLTFQVTPTQRNANIYNVLQLFQFNFVGLGISFFVFSQIPNFFGIFFMMTGFLSTLRRKVERAQRLKREIYALTL